MLFLNLMSATHVSYNRINGGARPPVRHCVACLCTCAHGSSIKYGPHIERYPWQHRQQFHGICPVVARDITSCRMSGCKNFNSRSKPLPFCIDNQNSFTPRSKKYTFYIRFWQPLVSKIRGVTVILNAGNHCTPLRLSADEAFTCEALSHMRNTQMTRKWHLGCSRPSSSILVTETVQPVRGCGLLAPLI